MALESGSDDLVAGYGPDFTHVLLHALGAGCAPSGAPGGGPGADTIAPRITRLRVTNRRFAVGRRRTPRIAKVRRGTTFVFRLSEDARTTITIARRKGRRLLRTATLVRARTRAGTNRIAYTGRIRRRVLRPGRYRATVRAVDAAANRSAPRRVAFTVVRR